ncbi:ABCB family ABC transporter ATP-binding protein/permease [Ahniella affigens]|uniref:ABCB family ABC transporter ATP-binding protein/permease n=1 Tax=Ahniella affigens TaxID=2021234 RepID=UPI001F0C4EDC|nr:ABC transporter ATP-binding protein/permease [Ahniella affigens]
MLALWPYVWRFRQRVFLALICLVAAKLSIIGVPVLLKRIVDTLNVAPDIRLAPLALLLAYGALRLSSTIFQELRQILFARVMARTARLLTLQVFEHLHALSLKFHLNRRTGAVSRDLERGMEAVTDLLDWTVYTILPTLFEITVVCIILIRTFDWTFALITLTTIACYVTYTFTVTEWRIRYYRAKNEANTRAAGRAVDSLLNYETVKYFNNERFESDSYNQTLRDQEEAEVKALKSLAVLNIGQSSIVAIGLTLLVWRAAEGVAANTLSIGDLVMVNAFLIQLAMPLNYLGMVYREVKQALTNIENMFALLAEQRDVADSPGARDLDPGTGGIVFDQVVFAYEPERPILRGISFEVKPGESVAVVGTTGAGKSTLARLLFRFYDVQSGSIRINGQDLRAVTQSSLRQAIGIVPQDTVLFNDSIGFNIRYGRVDATDAAVQEAARAAQLSHLITEMPKGFDTLVGERGLKLSGGEKQRVAIARTVLKNPPILILDEATSALDTRTERRIQAELEQLAKNRTSLIIAHRLSTIVHADQILVMDHGQIVERGRHDELLAMRGRYAQLWALQQHEQQEALAHEPA